MNSADEAFPPTEPFAPPKEAFSAPASSLAPGKRARKCGYVALGILQILGRVLSRTVVVTANNIEAEMNNGSVVQHLAHRRKDYELARTEDRGYAQDHSQADTRNR